jgi:putative transposase
LDVVDTLRGSFQRKIGAIIDRKPAWTAQGRDTGLLKEHGIQISMDGKGCWRDNVFVERLWRTVKYEEVYLRAYDSVSHARESLTRYFEIYNSKRPHTSLGRRTPDEVYFNLSPLPMAA